MQTIIPEWLKQRIPGVTAFYQYGPLYHCRDIYGTEYWVVEKNVLVDFNTLSTITMTMNGDIQISRAVFYNADNYRILPKIDNTPAQTTTEIN